MITARQAYSIQIYAKYHLAHIQHIPLTPSSSSLILEFDIAHTFSTLQILIHEAPPLLKIYYVQARYWSEGERYSNWVLKALFIHNSKSEWVIPSCYIGLEDGQLGVQNLIGYKSIEIPLIAKGNVSLGVKPDEVVELRGKL